MDDDGVYVLWWKFSKGSKGGVVRAYRLRETAEEDMAMLQDVADGMLEGHDGMKEFAVTPVDLR